MFHYFYISDFEGRNCGDNMDYYHLSDLSIDKHEISIRLINGDFNSELLTAIVLKFLQAINILQFSHYIPKFC
jgi:hypothetical protein